MNVTRLIIVAVGGQGNLLASRVLGEAALLADVPVHLSEIHGMAQRGGVVESALVFGPAESSLVADGEADVLVGFEPLETLRALGKCHADTTVITNLAPLSPTSVSTGKAVYPSLSRIQELVRAKTGALIAFDATRCAREAGNVMAVNMVLLGALIQTSLIPLARGAVVEAIRTRTKAAFVETNCSAFELGAAAARELAVA